MPVGWSSPCQPCLWCSWCSNCGCWSSISFTGDAGGLRGQAPTSALPGSPWDRVAAFGVPNMESVRGFAMRKCQPLGAAQHAALVHGLRAARKAHGVWAFQPMALTRTERATPRPTHGFFYQSALAQMRRRSGTKQGDSSLWKGPGWRTPSDNAGLQWRAAGSGAARRRAGL